MFRALSPILVLVVLATGSLAQSRLDGARPITAPIKHRGTYHVATGSWSRATPTSSSASGVLYNNTAPSGYFFGTTSVYSSVDHGRVPSLTSPDNMVSVAGTHVTYQVDCFEIAYCTEIYGGLTVITHFLNDYAPCSDIDAPSGGPIVAGFTSTGLPAAALGSSSVACWIVAFDLTNTTLSFQLRGDADGAWDDDPNADSFGWIHNYPQAVSNPSNNGTGPIIAGRCSLGGVPGGPASPQQGFGTQFGGVPGATDATGLGTADFFWLDDAGGALFPNANGGCFFFGGCTDPSTMGTARNPFGGFWLQLFGKGVGPPGLSCPSLPNATGMAAEISATYTDVNTDLVLTSTPVPNTSGLFFHGPMQLGGGTSLGDGVRCVGGMTTRLLPFVSAGMMMQLANTATLAIDYNAPYAAGLTGQRYFQHWFRSGLATGTGSNASDSIRIDF